METLEELRKVCQSPRKDVDTWYGKNIIRKVSIHVTRVFLSLGLTANAVTFIFMIVGLISCALLVVPAKWTRILAVILLHFWYLLDHVDGEVARYRKESSLTGIYFDGFLHYIIHPLIFICLGIGEYLATGNIVFVFLGFASGIAVIYVPLLALLETVVLRTKAEIISSGDSAGKNTEKPLSIKQAYSWICKSFTCPTFMIILTIAIAADIFTKLDLIKFTLYYYAIGGSITWATIFFGKIITHNLDKKGTYIDG